jgi:hypothetical protein
MTQTVPSDPVTRIFTFGYGHTCPHTGKDLGDHYVTITAPDMSSARLLMIAVFGKAWCTDYSGIDDPRLRGHGPRMVEHGRFSLGVPADTGHGYSREADDSTPPGARGPLHTGGVTDGGLVDETEVAEARAELAGHFRDAKCCGVLDDAPHQSFCAEYVPSACTCVTDPLACVVHGSSARASSAVSRAFRANSVPVPAEDATVTVLRQSGSAE